MKKLFIAIIFFTSLSSVKAATCPDYLNTDIKLLHSSKTINICEAYAEKLLLIVNTASHCGFTPQFKGLEALHQEFKDKGLVVLGFPSNSFRQEATSEKQTAEVCYMNYGVTFTMLATIPVSGKTAHSIFKELAAQSEQPSWNFNKYLVGKDGKVIEHFGSRVKPDSVQMIKKVKAAL